MQIKRLLALRTQKARQMQSFFRMTTQRRRYVRLVSVVRLLQTRFRFKKRLASVRAAQFAQDEAMRAERVRQRAEAAELQERARKEKEAQQLQQQMQMQFKDSYTASSDSSSEASLTSNDIEGSYCSSMHSEDTFAPSGLTTVDEASSQYPLRATTVGHLPRNGQMAMDNLRPIKQPEGIVRATGSMRKTSSAFRTTRSSRAVGLPRLDVVQETQWVNDEDRFSCHICNKRFSVFKRKHHCRACGEVICNTCSLYHRIRSRSMRVCVSCVAFHSLDSPTSSSSTMAGSFLRSTRMGSNGALSRKASTESGMDRSSTTSSGLWLNAWPEPPCPVDEDERLAVLRMLNVRELALSGKFNMYCEVAAKTMKCPIAYVSIMDDEEQILVANIGMAHTTLARELSFCAHTICQPSVLVVLDTKNDDRFRENPMVKGDKGSVKIRYYAGATIFSNDGHALGTVAVLDTKPRRETDQEHIGMLQHLSFLASEKMTQSVVHEDSESEFL